MMHEAYVWKVGTVPADLVRLSPCPSGAVPCQEKDCHDMPCKGKVTEVLSLAVLYTGQLRAVRYTILLRHLRPCD